MEIKTITKEVPEKQYIMSEVEYKEKLKEAVQSGVREGYDLGFLDGRIDYRNEIVRFIRDFELTLNMGGCVELVNRLSNKLKFFTK